MMTILLLNQQYNELYTISVNDNITLADGAMAYPITKVTDLWGDDKFSNVMSVGEYVTSDYVSRLPIAYNFPLTI